MPISILATTYRNLHLASQSKAVKCNELAAAVRKVAILQHPLTDDNLSSCVRAPPPLLHSRKLHKLVQMLRLNSLVSTLRQRLWPSRKPKKNRTRLNRQLRMQRSRKTPWAISLLLQQLYAKNHLPSWLFNHNRKPHQSKKKQESVSLCGTWAQKIKQHLLPQPQTKGSPCLRHHRAEKRRHRRLQQCAAEAGCTRALYHLSTNRRKQPLCNSQR